MSTELTGKIRYRLYKPLFRKEKIILQVEVSKSGVQYDHTDPYDYEGRPWSTCDFRDATFEDLQELKLLNKE